jgi:UDP-N-acetyl-2-amino-2-deoxyglucuronate dehydrogenase
MMRCAVIGCGDVSIVHVQAINGAPDAQLVGVCDTEPGRAERYGVPSFTDHREMLTTVRPDVVHICTPHDQHVRAALDSLEAGAHVLLEKPVAHTVAEADRLITAAAAYPDRKVGVCLQNRYNATSQAAHRLLASGELGAVLGSSASVLWHRDAAYYTDRPWRGRLSRSGGGVLINQAIHTLDLLQWLLGEVTEVRGHTGRYALNGGVDVEDTAQVLLRHAGGARTVFAATVGHVVDAPVTIEIITERATLLIRGDLTLSHTDGRVETVADARRETGGRAYWGASHELLISDFYRALAEPYPFWISVQEGSRSLRLVDRIYRLND